MEHLTMHKFRDVIFGAEPLGFPCIGNIAIDKDLIPPWIIKPPRTRRPRILDLPVELLLKIIEEGPVDPFKLACLSRNFNSFIISLCFPELINPSRPHHLDSITVVFTGSHTQFHSPPITPKFTSNAGAISFLSIAFHLKTIDRFVWELADSMNPSHYTPIEYYRCLFRFLKRLERVDHISFINPGSPKFSSTEAKQTVAITNMLNIAMERLQGGQKGGEGFEMVGGLFQLGDYKVQSNWGLGTRMKGVFSDIQNPTLHGPNWDVTRRSPFPAPLLIMEEDVSLSSGAQKAAEMTKKFKISSIYLLQPPLSEWTYRFLSAAPLTSLTLDTLFCSMEWWNTILSWLSTAVNRLEDLTIRRCSQISARSLAQFLLCLPRLKRCILEGTRPTFGPLEVIPFDLPDLVTFIAPSHFIHTMRPKGLRVSKRLLGIPSSLSKLHIVPNCLSNSNHGHPYPKSGCNSFVEEVLDAYSNVPWIILDMRKSEMSDFDFGQADAGLTWWGAKETTDSGARVPGASFGRVKELIVSKRVVGALTSTPTDTAMFPEFLSVLKGLKVLRMVHDGNTAIMANSDGNGDDDVAHPTFLKLLKSSCPTLDIVEVEGIDGKGVVHGFG